MNAAPKGINGEAVRALSRDPLAFCRRVLKVEPWEMQRRILRALWTPGVRTVAVKSAHGTGKSYQAAAATHAWLYGMPDRQVITTAPGMRQVGNVWREIRAMYRGAEERGTPLGGEMPPRAFRLHISERWHAIGFSSDKPEAVVGSHVPNGTLVVMDEANGVAAPIWDALLGLLTGENDKLLVIFNPTRANGPSYDLWREDHAGYQMEHIPSDAPLPEGTPASLQRFTISAYDTPNVQAGREVVKGLVTRGWVEWVKKKWGVNNPNYKARVLGQFPDGGDHTVVPHEWFDLAVQRWHDAEDLGWSGVHRFGLDVAREGPDDTVAADFFPGLGVRALHRHIKASTTDTAWWMSTLVDRDCIGVNVDADGIGAGVFDRLVEFGDVPGLVDMRGMRAAQNHQRFFNARSEWYWNLRERLDPQGPDPIALPPDDALRGQLTALEWKEVKGRIFVERKEDWRKRLPDASSPDEADAVCYAVWDESGTEHVDVDPMDLARDGTFAIE